MPHVPAAEGEETGDHRDQRDGEDYDQSAGQSD
jgi:hypothetical protein